MDLHNYKEIELDELETRSMPLSIQKSDELLDIDSPAMKVFDDYIDTQAVTIVADTNIVDAKKKIIFEKADAALVIDTNSKVTGFLSLQYLEGVSIQKQAQKLQKNVTDLTADEAMIAISEISMLNYSKIGELKVGHIIKTFEKTKDNQILVYEKTESEYFMRGYFSLIHLRDKLNINL